MYHGGVIKQTFHTAMVVYERVILSIPNGIACEFHQRFGHAPANKEVCLCGSMGKEIVQLALAHDAGRQFLETTRAQALHIHSDWFMMECQAEAIA